MDGSSSSQKGVSPAPTCVAGTVPDSDLVLAPSCRHLSCGRAWSCLICFVTGQDSHYFTSLLNLRPNWQESNVACHRSGYPAPDAISTLWTHNSSPFPSRLVHLLDNSAHPGKGKLMSLFHSSLTQVVNLQWADTRLHKSRQEMARCLLVMGPADPHLRNLQFFRQVEALSN